MRRILIPVIGVALLLLALRGCTGSDGTADADQYVFTVNKSMESGEIEEKLLAQDYMKGRPLFGLMLLLHGGYGGIDPGGYRFPADIGSWALASQLAGDPPLKWVTIPEGLRREQVADRLADGLGWSAEAKAAFVTLQENTEGPYELTEGFYFPDTYLIPVSEEPEKVWKRFANRFNEQFDPLLPELDAQNIRYNTAVRLASIIQREAAGTEDMELIAGVLWNRLLTKMKLEVDATLQYMRGDEGNGYWAPIDVAIKKTDSPYNTYMYAGLPPQPISNPGIAAIQAVLHPEETDCLFYLHDNNRQIHCSADYQGHLDNIETYLR